MKKVRKRRKSVGGPAVLAHRNAMASDENEDAEAEHDRLSFEVDRLQHEVEDLSFELDGVKEDNELLQDSVVEGRQKLQERDARIAALEAELVGLRYQLVPAPRPRINACVELGLSARVCGGLLGLAAASGGSEQCLIPPPPHVITTVSPVRRRSRSIGCDDVVSALKEVGSTPVPSNTSDPNSMEPGASIDVHESAQPPPPPPPPTPPRTLSKDRGGRVTPSGGGRTTPRAESLRRSSVVTRRSSAASRVSSDGGYESAVEVQAAPAELKSGHESVVEAPVVHEIPSAPPELEPASPDTHCASHAPQNETSEVGCTASTDQASTDQAQLESLQLIAVTTGTANSSQDELFAQGTARVIEENTVAMTEGEAATTSDEAMLGDGRVASDEPLPPPPADEGSVDDTKLVSADESAKVDAANPPPSAVAAPVEAEVQPLATRRSRRKSVVSREIVQGRALADDEAASNEEAAPPPPPPPPPAPEEARQAARTPRSTPQRRAKATAERLAAGKAPVDGDALVGGVVGTCEPRPVADIAGTKAVDAPAEVLLPLPPAEELGRISDQEALLKVGLGMAISAASEAGSPIAPSVAERVGTMLEALGAIATKRKVQQARGGAKSKGGGKRKGGGAPAKGGVSAGRVVQFATHDLSCVAPPKVSVAPNGGERWKRKGAFVAAGAGNGVVPACWPPLRALFPSATCML